MSINQPSIFSVTFGLILLLVILTVFVIFLAFAFSANPEKTGSYMNRFWQQTKDWNSWLMRVPKSFGKLVPRFPNPLTMPAGFNVIYCRQSIY